MKDYDVLLERAAERGLRKLPQTDLRRVVAALKKLAKSPRPRGAKKLVGKPEAWRIRVGRYRVLYMIDDREREVRVLRVRHRREAYR